MTGRWSDEEKRGDMETMGQMIRSSLFCSYIWLCISSSLTLMLTVKTSSVKAYFLLKSVACTPVCPHVCVPLHYFCSCHGNIRSSAHEDEVDVHWAEVFLFLRRWSWSWPSPESRKQFECIGFCCLELDSVLVFVTHVLSSQRGLASFDSAAQSWRASCHL